MNVVLLRLEVVTRKTTETIRFALVTFLHGPVGSGKSTVARLIDFCLGGRLVATPAIQSELVLARLFLQVGVHDVVLERDKLAESAVRATWRTSIAKSGNESEVTPSESVLAPLVAEKGTPLLNSIPHVENLSDLMFHLAGTVPIKVRKNKRDADAPLVRLSFRDLLFYCYLDQDGLDSSFFFFEHPFKKQKSLDAMRFIVGFHSTHLNDLEQRLYKAIDAQRAKRNTAEQLERVMKDLAFDGETQIVAQLQELSHVTGKLKNELAQVEADRRSNGHPMDAMRESLRCLHERLLGEERDLGQLRGKLSGRESLRAELITAKLKALRADASQRVLGQVHFKRCPQCETAIQDKPDTSTCSLCGQVPAVLPMYEELAGEFDERVDELEELIRRQRGEVAEQERRVARLRSEKSTLDSKLEVEAQRYDAAFVSRLRELERAIAEMNERAKHLQQLRRIPVSLGHLMREAAELQGEIDAARKGIENETLRLKNAHKLVEELASSFKELLVRVGFPGMSAQDAVVVDTDSWEPRIYHDTLAWGFEDLGSGGKKVLFKVLYALAIHELAARRGLPLPTFLIVDSATKNISHDVNPDLFVAFYKEVYRVAMEYGRPRQFILIDSELVRPPDDLADAFSERLLDHSDEYPPLISYYRGH